MVCDKAVLLIVFNRPDTTVRVFEAIRQAKPPRLYIAADGPRLDRPGEAELCSQSRAIAEKVDWPCEVKTLFRDQNLGCRLGVSGAISWFFETEESGIILEDDCLPHLDFFRYCSELLDHYVDDDRVMVVSGDNSLPGAFPSDKSFDFATHPFIWGWGTWKRAWQNFDFDVFLSDDHSLHINGISQKSYVRNYYLEIFEQIRQGHLDSWAYVWLYFVTKCGGLCSIPSKNLISNIGFGEAATHTFNPDDTRANQPFKALEWPLVYPAVEVNSDLNESIECDVYKFKKPKGPIRRFRRKLSSILFGKSY
ncbi:glycosyltransferase family 2 protein [Roseibium sp.]|uniref:glycosyltransferase family 2 protein n=1 Tax=Roseibium sp. TaxID=1936156 RepID=UPI003A9703A2